MELQQLSATFIHLMRLAAELGVLLYGMSSCRLPSKLGSIYLRLLNYCLFGTHGIILRVIFGTGQEVECSQEKRKESRFMKGYYTAQGFYGLVDDRYVLFSDETEYYEYLEEDAA